MRGSPELEMNPQMTVPKQYQTTPIDTDTPELPQGFMPIAKVEAESPQEARSIQSLLAKMGGGLKAFSTAMDPGTEKNQNFYQNYGIPLMMLAESMASGGKSPGTATAAGVNLGESQKKSALERAIAGKKISDKGSYEEAVRKAIIAARAEGREITDEELKNLYKEHYSEEYSSKIPYDESGDGGPAAVTEEMLGGVSDTVIKELGKRAVTGDKPSAKQFWAEYSASKSKSAQSAPEKPSDIAKIEMDMRKEFRSDKRVAEFETVDSQYSRIQAVWDDYIIHGSDSKKPKSLIAIDQAIVNLYNKLLDPGSVVRESEFARTADGQAAIEQLKGIIPKLLQGGIGLTDDERRAVVEGASIIHGVVAYEYNKILDDYRKSYEPYQESLGIDLERVLRSPRDLIKEPIKAPDPKETGIILVNSEDEYNKLPVGTKYRKPGDSKGFRIKEEQHGME